MSLLKKVLIISFILIMAFSVSAFAEDVPGSVKISFNTDEIPTVKEQAVTFGIFDASGQTLFDSKTVSVKRGVYVYDVDFAVPEYNGEATYILKITDGGGDMTLNGITASTLTLNPFSLSGEGATCFSVKYNPIWNYEAVIKIPGVSNTLFYHYIMPDDVYVTTDLLSQLGIECKTDFGAEKPNFTLSVNEYSATFYVDDIYATFGGVGENLTGKAFVTDSMPFVPLSRVATYFACNYTLEKEDAYHKAISLTMSLYSDEYKKAAYVNSLDTESKTDYLVWVDKSEYSVNVYLGTTGNWRLIKSFPCAIGAPKTPTIEGSFEYYQYQDRWQYNGYYCGPIMRFKGGYALHSVLIRNNGNFYDGRVRAKISHGCVRMLPDDIKWMVSYVPLYTRILVTA